MNIFKFITKFIAKIFFVIIFFSPLQAKNIEEFNSRQNISDYLSGILLLKDNQYDESHKFLKKLDGLEKIHINYSSKYLSNLVNLGRFNEAFNYSKKLEKNNLGNFESNLIIGVHHLKNENYDLAHKYFLKLKNIKSNFILDNFVSDSLTNWISFKDLDLRTAKDKINEVDPRFDKLKSIQNIFLHCFYNSQKTEFFFEDLVLNKKNNFSRYNYFYAIYLINVGKIEKAKKITKSSLKMYPRNLLLNQFQLDLDLSKYNKNFNCKNLPHIVAEIFYITANVLSSENLFVSSNFYFNLSKYLNKDFYSFHTLSAENFYKRDNFTKAKKIYKDISKRGEAYFWYSAKQNAKIFIKEEKREKAMSLISNSYNKLSKKNTYETYDYARFLKNNDKFQDAVKYYTQIIKKINKNHPLYSKVTDGRGVAYERLGKWNKAEKDLLSSLEVNPNQAYVLNYLAYSWIEKGVKIEQSLKMLRKANDLKPNDPFILDSLGWALFKLKRYKESKLYLQLAVQLMPDDPVINNHYGDVMWKSKNEIQARYYWQYVLNLKATEKNLKVNIKNKLILGL